MELYFNKSIGRYISGQTRDVPDSLARVYLRRNIASKAVYQTKVMHADVEKPEVVMTPIDDFESIDDVEVLRSIAKERGIDVHHRAGADKIKGALRGD